MSIQEQAADAPEGANMNNLKLVGWTEVDFQTAAKAMQAGHPVRQLWNDAEELEESSSGLFLDYRCWIPDAAATPEGFVLVPVEPTVAMLRPFIDCPDDELTLAWQAMIAASKGKKQP